MTIPHNMGFSPRQSRHLSKSAMGDPVQLYQEVSDLPYSGLCHDVAAKTADAAELRARDEAN